VAGGDDGLHHRLRVPAGCDHAGPDVVRPGGAKPVDVLRAAQQQVKNTSGRYGTEFTMSSELLNYILLAPDTVARFNFQATANFAPQVTTEMLKQLLWEPDNVDVEHHRRRLVRRDRGLRVEPARLHGPDKTRWVPKDTFIVQARVPTSVRRRDKHHRRDRRSRRRTRPRARPIPTRSCRCTTGWSRSPSPGTRCEYRGPGAQTYQTMSDGNFTVFYRYEARRMPMIHHPERICVTKAVF
jgi:hypothetical protein